MREFAVHIWADESGPSALPRTTFEQLEARYPVLRSSVAQALLGCHAGLSSVDEVARHLNPTVGCYIEHDGCRGHADFERVYSFDLQGEGARGYFARIVGWEIVATFIAE